MVWYGKSENEEEAWVSVTEKCETCRFWKSTGRNDGRCRFNQPIPIDRDWCIGFPVTDCNEWCGQWTDKRSKPVNMNIELVKMEEKIVEHLKRFKLSFLKLVKEIFNEMELSGDENAKKFVKEWHKKMVDRYGEGWDNENS
jgi:hypothetical protein